MREKIFFTVFDECTLKDIFSHFSEVIVSYCFVTTATGKNRVAKINLLGHCMTEDGENAAEKKLSF